MYVPTAQTCLQPENDTSIGKSEDILSQKTSPNFFHSAAIESSTTTGPSDARSVTASIGPPLIVISSAMWPQNIHTRLAKSVTSVPTPAATEHRAVLGMGSLERIP